MKQRLSGWGGRPRLISECKRFRPVEALSEINKGSATICHANGRSYGDSALYQNTLHTKSWNHFLDFDESNGVIDCQAGVLLSDIIETFVPRGWFLKVVPGTQKVTVGGAIASDVHGKNHHQQGCFSESVISMQLLLPSGQVLTCSSEENEDYFHASCGGMGLTGVIVSAKIQLQKIPSALIQQTNKKTQNLRETFEVLESMSSEPYSVAWIDCLAKDDDMGRGIVSYGRFAKSTAEGKSKPKRKVSIPFNLPSFTLAPWIVRLFNRWHYKSSFEGTREMQLETFFFPLDRISHWNRIYGTKGFYQYQFVLPKEKSYQGMERILKIIAESERASFLCVLKLCGERNKNWLSFPMKGYSLALDFKYHPSLESLFRQIDDIVLENGGRFYLAKDARVSKAVFEKGYPNIERFRSFRKENQLDRYFQSLQSQRLGL